MAIGLLFSGQGAQHVGMGRSLYDHHETARVLYDTADNVLGWSLKEISFAGPEENLTPTKVCQPALYVHGYVVYKLLEERGALAGGIGAALGLSLGELTALAVAGVFDFDTGLRIVEKRGALMQMACDQTDGGMAAIIGADPTQVAELCREHDVDMANLNCPGQIVISGREDLVLKAVESAKAMGIKRAVPLKVAGAYHSRLMEPAREQFEAFLQDIVFTPPKVPVFSNVTGGRVDDPAEIKALLVRQVVSPVRWEADFRAALELGLDGFVECGPGAVLAGFAKRMDREASVASISEHEDLEKFDLQGA